MGFVIISFVKRYSNKSKTPISVSKQKMVSKMMNQKLTVRMDVGVRININLFVERMERLT